MAKPQTILFKDWNQHKKEEQERASGLLKFLGIGVLYLMIYFLIDSLGNFSQETKIIFTMIMLVLIGILYMERKNIFRKIKSKKSHKKENKNNYIFSFKIFFIYGLTFSIGYWISTLFIPFIKTTNLLVLFLLVGLILELSAKVCQLFLYNKKKIIIDKWFIMWVLIHSVVAYGVLYLVKFVEITNKYLFILVVGFGIAIITNLIWRFLYKNEN
jgi:uncharacterized membrane protein YbjE (DUF340 family)